MPSSKSECIFIIVSLLAIGIFLEAALRVLHVRYDASFYTADSELGWALRPGAEGWFVSEGSQYVRINGAGFHDREHAIAKPADTLRIAVLGNSWTEAMQIPVDKTFPSVLERDLSGCTSFRGRTKVEVLNFGVSGYSTAQEFLLLHNRVWKYQPDIVLLAFYTAKDVFNNVRSLNNAAAPEQSPYYVYRRGRFVLDDSFRNLPQVHGRNIKLQNLRGSIADHFLLFEAVNHVVRSLRVIAARNVLAAQAERLGTKSLDDTIYAPPQTPILDEAWKVTEGILLMMRDEVRSHGAEFRIVNLANRPQVNPNLAAQEAYLQKLALTNLAYPDERLTAFAHDAQIPITLLAPKLAFYSRSHHVFLNGFENTAPGEGHWNELGHRLAGDAIAADLCATPIPQSADHLVSALP
jgi:hypothetical protein